MTESFNFHVDTNLRGVFYCMKHEIRQILKNGGGAIVDQSSIAVAISLSSTVSGLRGRFTV